MKKPYLVILPTLFFGIILGAYLKPIDVIQTAQGATNNFNLVNVKEDVFTQEKLLEYMRKLNIKHIEFTFAQTQIESAYYSSPIFYDNKNMFGMKQSYERPTTCIGTNRNHANYENWRDAVLDFAIFQARVLAKVKNRNEYREYIGKYYADDKEYLKKVDTKIKENKLSGIFK